MIATCTRSRGTALSEELLQPACEGELLRRLERHVAEREAGEAGVDERAEDLGGLLGRERTGQGAFIDVSLAETALAWQGWGLTADLSGAAPAREGALLNGGAAYYRIYRTEDGKFIALGALEEKFWRNFCDAVGRPEWVSRHADPLPQAGLIAEVAALIAGANRAEWDRRLGNADCCYQSVLDYGEVLDHPQAAARGLIRRAGSGGSRHVETAFAALVGGKAPPARAPFRDVTAEEAAADWSEKG